MVSLWNAITDPKIKYPSLETDLDIEVLIVGGGITGITAAKQLVDAGKSVAVIDAFEIGGVTTASSTGNLYIPIQPLYQSIESKFNLETAKVVAQSRQIAMDYIESTVNEYNIKCHFKKRPWYAYSNVLKNSSFCRELNLLKKMGLDVEYTKELPLSVKYKEAMMMPNQARFNPLQYIQSLSKILHKKGCHFFEHTQALKIEEDSSCTVITKQAKITAQQVLLATHTPIGINPTQFYTAAYRSYVVAATLKNKEYPEGHFWSLDEPSPVLCTHPITQSHPELLMVADRHHKTGQGEDMNKHYKELERFLKSQFDVEDIAYQWSAQHYHAADNIPYIGLAHASAKHTYMATGYFADGLIYGTLAGIILGDLLAGKENAFFKIYNANRKDFWKSSAFLLREGSNVFLQYLKDIPFFTSNQYKDLKKGEGKIVEYNRVKYAVSKDDDNELHVVSAVCPHMKGIVAWNNAEGTWDCPVHGSRFTNKGEVIEGPAICPLRASDLPQGSV